jgi:hypothetical protein
LALPAAGTGADLVCDVLAAGAAAIDPRRKKLATAATRIRNGTSAPHEFKQVAIELILVGVQEAVRRALVDLEDRAVDEGR